jgi:hypothetical protein
MTQTVVGRQSSDNLNLQTGRAEQTPSARFHFRPGLIKSNLHTKPDPAEIFELAPEPCIYYNLPSPGQRFQGYHVESPPDIGLRRFSENIIGYGRSDPVLLSVGFTTF